MSGGGWCRPEDLAPSPACGGAWSSGRRCPPPPGSRSRPASRPPGMSPRAGVRGQSPRWAPAREPLRPSVRRASPARGGDRGRPSRALWRPLEASSGLWGGPGGRGASACGGPLGRWGGSCPLDSQGISRRRSPSGPRRGASSCQPGGGPPEALSSAQAPGRCGREGPPEVLDRDPHLVGRVLPAGRKSQPRRSPRGDGSAAAIAHEGPASVSHPDVGGDGRGPPRGGAAR